MKIVSKIVGLELITTTWPGFASAFFAPLLLRETISISRETWRMETWRKIDVVARLRQISIVLYFTFLFFFLPRNIKLCTPLTPGHFVANVSKFRGDHVGNLDSLTHLRNTSPARPGSSNRIVNHRI